MKIEHKNGNVNLTGVKGSITWHWSENPIGFPTDPDDFKSPRTPPLANLAIEYKDGDSRLRNAVSNPNRTLKTLNEWDKHEMKTHLLNWLKAQLDKL